MPLSAQALSSFSNHQGNNILWQAVQVPGQHGSFTAILKEF